MASLKRWQIDRVLALGGIVAGVVAYFLLGYAAPDYISTGVMLSISCALYLLLSRQDKISRAIDTAHPFPSPLYLLFNVIFFALLSYSTLILHFNNYERPLGYFISIALMSALVAWEILDTPEEAKGHSAFVLMKILVIALSLRWSLFYIYPGSFLGQDPWWNAVAFEDISQAGHLIRDVGGYYYMPVQHFMVVITSQLTGIAIREAMVLSLSLFEATSLIFVFLLGRNIFNNRTGLLATLILAINNLHIMWGWWLVAQTVGIALVTMIVFLVLSSRGHDIGKFKIISMVMLILLIFTHSVSSFVMFIVLLISYLGYLIYTSLGKEKVPYVSGNIMLFFGVALLGYWLYISQSFPFFAGMILGTGPGVYAPIPYAPTLVTEVNPAWADINRICSLLFYGLATIGILSILNPRNIDSPRFNLAFCGILLTGIVFTVFFLVRAELAIGRWFIFMDLLLAIPAAAGLILLSGTIRTNWGKSSIPAVLVFLLTFSMITNTLASFDSPLYPSYLETRSALMESELRAADTIKSIRTDTIIMDSTHMLALEVSPAQAPVKTLSYQDIMNEFAEINGLLVVRRYIVDHVFFAPSEGVTYKAEVTYDPYQSLDKNRFKRVYDVGTVSAYLP